MSDEKSLTSEELSMQRTLMAAERTFMAWIRTSISLISFGFTIPKVLEYAEDSKQLVPHLGPRNLGAALITLGVFALATSAYQHWRVLQRAKVLRMFGSSQLSLVVASVLVLLGVFAMLNILFNIGPF